MIRCRACAPLSARGLSTVALLVRRISQLNIRVAGSEAGSDSSVVDTEMWDSRTMPNYNRLVLTSRVYERVDRTPLQHAAVLSTRLGNGNAVWIKREDLQPGFSFKIRGVVNKMSHIPATDLAKGVVSFTTGSHGECLARVASEFGTSATVVRVLCRHTLRFLYKAGTGL